MPSDEEIAQHRIRRAADHGGTKLRLDDLGLTRVPDEVRSLSRLEHLDLSENYLTELPDWIGELEQLVTLNLNWNELTVLPDWIRGLHKLRQLEFHRNRLTRLPQLPAGLIGLATGANPLAELPAWISDLRNLRDLDVSELGLIRLPDWIGELDRLTSLDIAANRLARLPDWLGDLTGLQQLCAHRNRLTHVPASIAELTELHALNLWENRLTEIPDWIGGLRGLRYLDLADNLLTELPASLGELTQLSTLYLNYNQLTCLPDSLARLRRLARLNLGSNRFTELPEWIGALPRLKRLRLSSSGLGELPPWLRRLDRLVDLDLRDNDLAEIPDWIGKFGRLRSFWIENNRLTALPDHIRELSHLSVLHAGGNKFESLPDWLGDCRRLTSLEVDYCELKSLPTSLSRLTKLSRLRLRGNALSELPEWIGGFHRLTDLDLGRGRLTQVPESIKSLSRIRVLSIDGNPLAEPTDWISRLPRLRILDLGDEGMDRIPEWVRGLDRLSALSVTNSRLTRLPEWIAELRRLESLTLASNRLTALPKGLRQLRQLTYLNLTDNKLTQLPAWIGDLHELTFLGVSTNELAELPDSIGQLTDLTVLHLAGNRLSTLPPSVHRLGGLRHLWLARNGLTRIPEALRGLTGLRKLYLAANELAELPDWIGSLTSLCLLDFDGNELTSLPGALSGLQSLYELDLSKNNLTELPECLRELRHLRTLYLHRNKLSSLPGWLVDYPELTELTVEDNPLLSPPPEITAVGTASTLQFLRARAQGSSRQWLSKMLVVGEGGVGKTSTIKKLLGRPFDPAESTTHGLRVFEYGLPHPELADTTMTLSTWDFGGQEIYHATHQFFLTERSLFLLLWNSRLGWAQGRLRYWLDIIAARAPKSPVLLVATNAPGGGRPVDLPLGDLQREYPQIIANIRIDNETGDGLPVLKAVIAQLAAALPLMGTEWPVTWLDAANAVRAMPDTHTAPAQLWRTMAKAGLHDPQHQRYVAAALHQLGDILYYERDPELNDTVVLQPDWVNGYISKVLDSPEVERCHGLLRRDHVNELWGDLDRGLRDHFLGMMDRYDLSYRVDGGQGGDLSLVVERLPWNAPPYQERWDRPAQDRREHEIRVVYQLNTTPPGIPTWFIARSHRFSTGTHWRTGALLAHPDGQHRALIRTDTHRNAVELAVRGPSPAAFFAVLDDGLNLTLERYPGLSIKRMVPCPCANGRGGACTESFDYEDLQRRLARTPPRHEIECRKSGEEIHVPLLLLGLAPSERDEWRGSLERLTATAAANQKELVGRFDEISGDLERQFLKVQQQIQTGLEISCPSVFVVTAVKNSRLTGSAYQLSLYCEEPGAWHPLPEDAGTYQLSESPLWLRRVAPYLRELVNVLKHAAPLVSPVLGISVDKLDAHIKADADAMKALVDQIKAPDVVQLPPALAGAEESSQNAVSVAPAEHAGSEADFRALRALLTRLDPDRVWGGLSRIDTPEGLTLYLCRDHAAPYLRTARAPGSV